MNIEEFDYTLPPALIAQYPSSQRGQSRLMALDRKKETIGHHLFADLLNHLNPGDLLVVNNTKVLPARLIGKKETGGRVEVLVLPLWNGNKGEWEVLIKGAKKLKKGSRIDFGQDLYGTIEEMKDGKGKLFFSVRDEIFDILRKIGHIPLPPYIKRADEPLDQSRYQTIFAEKDGAVAAPTAGLHFSPSLLQSLKEKGVKIVSVTLHVGIGTFSPVKVSRVEDHRMETEWAEIPDETSLAIEETKARGGKVIAVGTTTTRALESFPDGKGGVKPLRGGTSLFVFPPYRFQVIDGLITNFHLPKSTLIMLVSAFAGKDFLVRAYREAIEKNYLFYSYGDAMLIL